MLKQIKYTRLTAACMREHDCLCMQNAFTRFGITPIGSVNDAIRKRPDFNW